MQTDAVLYAIRSAWDNKTAFPMPESELLNEDCSKGQCAVTAVIIQEYLGGEIRKGLVNGDIRHYWNILDGEKLDITEAQFRTPITITEERTVDRCRLLADEGFYSRYSILKARVEAFIQRYREIEGEIEHCHMCKGAVEHFAGSTIFFGRENDILILGEAPASNGWRKSGTVWRDINGKLIPSGKRLYDLLALCSVDLFACSFIETAKCYPLARKDLFFSANNCADFLCAQVDLLAPKLILPLGKVATQLILSTSEPFDSLVGRSFEVQFSTHRAVIFPLYHPSPASPRSWKNNIQLMPKLENLIRKW